MKKDRKSIIANLAKKRSIKPVHSFRMIDENTFICTGNNTIWTAEQVNQHRQSVYPHQPIIFEVINDESE